MSRIAILGAGPAGSAAALSGLSHGAGVELIDKSRFPRHKVCGEFLSPEIQIVLERLGVWNRFIERGPARISRMVLHFGSKSVRTPLPERGFGLSRFAFDSMLVDAAIERGAVLRRASESGGTPLVIATGRSAVGARGNRLFGFKAHFEGPQDDAVELFFFGGCYVGLNSVESGITNVCGLGPEQDLRRFDFDVDALVASCAALRERTTSLRRVIPWMHVGPLVFRNELHHPRGSETYVCGDALSFVDPFTGSGLLSAVITGDVAGRYAAEALPVHDYVAECRRKLQKPFLVSSLFRTVARQPWAGHVAAAIPGTLLFRWTRPRPAA